MHPCGTSIFQNRENENHGSSSHRGVLRYWERDSETLSSKGHIVYGAARRVEKMQDLAPNGVKPVAMDLNQDDSMQNAVKTILQNEEKLDALINCAGYGSLGALEDIPLSEARRQFEVNVFGMARLIQLVLPQMRKQHGGCIVNISSSGGFFGEPHASWYHAAKYAVEGLSDSLRMELAEFGINVVVIRPGSVVSEWAGIAVEHFKSVSANTAYKNTVAHIRMLEKADGKTGIQPIAVAKCVEKSLTAKRPKPRYTVGADAKLLLFLKGILSDRMFDRFVLSLIGR